MVLTVNLSDGQAMRRQLTTRAQPCGGRVRSPVLRWAGRYALPTAVFSAGTLMTELSSGVGWALIVFGASLAALALQRPGPSGVDRKPRACRDHPARDHLARRPNEGDDRLVSDQRSD
jgi:hypothetical protein